MGIAACSQPCREQPLCGDDGLGFEVRATHPCSASVFPDEVTNFTMQAPHASASRLPRDGSEKILDQVLNALGQQASLIDASEVILGLGLHASVSGRGGVENRADRQPQMRGVQRPISTCGEGDFLQDAMFTFIRTLVRGICVEVLLDDGSVLFPEASLNYEVTHLLLDVNEAQRAIPLEDIESVEAPSELYRRKILTGMHPYLDERCCTLIIKNLEFVTFRFDTERMREYFTACLLLLIAQRGEEVHTGSEVSDVTDAKFEQVASTDIDAKFTSF